MKFCIFFTVFFLVAIDLMAATTVLISVTKNGSTSEGCKIYCREEGEDFNYNSPIVTITEEAPDAVFIVTVTAPEEVVIYLTARNVNSGEESSDSNQATNNPDFIPEILGVERTK